MQQLVLNQNWYLKQRDEFRDLGDDFASADGWLPTTVPGSVHETPITAAYTPPLSGQSARLQVLTSLPALLLRARNSRLHNYQA